MRSLGRHVRTGFLIVVVIAIQGLPAAASTSSASATKPALQLAAPAWNKASDAGAASGMTLAQAPKSLRTAVQSAIGSLSGSPQQAELTASDSAKHDDFGTSVAISGSVAVVGAVHKNESAGAAYIFARSGTTWSQQAELTASDTGYFGNSVAISGSTVVVGAPATNLTGAVYIFVGSGSTWTEQATLTASDPANNYFGVAVAISGSTVLVGADTESGTRCPPGCIGAAYVFVRSGTIWKQQAKLTASDGASGDLFGNSVSISGSTAVVGAEHKNSPTGAAGAAYVFHRVGATWSQEAELTQIDPPTGSGVFGYSVAVLGSTAVVSAAHAGSGPGAAYVYVGNGGTWTLQAELTASDGLGDDQFGVSVDISGSTVVVGAMLENSYKGAAYVFVRTGTSWRQELKLTAADGSPGNYFGTSVAIYGSTVVVGAYGKRTSRGAAYVYKLV